MKFTSALIVLASAAAAIAQGTYIRNPVDGTSVKKGESVVLQLVRPWSHQGSREVGLALSFQTCPDGTCPNPTQELGTVLYIGTYNPVIHEIPGNPYQNFTLTIPSSDFIQPGKAQLVSSRFHLIGAGPTPELATNVAVINVINP